MERSTRARNTMFLTLILVSDWVLEPILVFYSISYALPLQKMFLFSLILIFSCFAENVLVVSHIWELYVSVCPCEEGRWQLSWNSTAEVLDCSSDFVWVFFSQVYDQNCSSLGSLFQDPDTLWCGTFSLHPAWPFSVTASCLSLGFIC